MSALGRYVRTHWRGDQPLLQATLVNGVLGYAVLVAAFIGTIQLTGPWRSGSASGRLLGSTSLVLLVAWVVWAAVGIVRRVLKRYLPATQPIWRRLVGAMVLLVVVGFAVISINDVLNLLGLAGS